MRCTKIICTIGPATSGVENLVRLIEAGMDGARLNFSHGTREQHSHMIDDIRAASERTGKPIAIIQDLQGPKIRVGRFEGGEAELCDGNEFIITCDDLPEGNSQRVATRYKNLAREVPPGATILLDDGYIIVKVDRIERNDIVTTVVKGGVLRDNKGIIAPGSTISAPSMSEKDIEDLRFGLEQGVDVVALSFVRSERDVIELRSIMRMLGRSVPVVAKIERYEAYADIDDIIRESDGIMVARGDLGLEMPAESVPVLQKEIIRRCNQHGKPVITATQMLESMINNPRPTRAEASDVANAVLDGSDCVMLSGETSVGRYPFEAVDYMHKIILSIEAQAEPCRTKFIVPQDTSENTVDAIGRSCCVLAEQIHAAAIVSLTISGGSAKIVAKYRPRVPIIAVTDSAHTLRRMSVVWGVVPMMIPSLESDDANALLKDVTSEVVRLGFVSKGDALVYTAGYPFGARVPTNMIYAKHAV
jgi:pyruvate kinase